MYFDLPSSIPTGPRIPATYLPTCLSTYLPGCLSLQLTTHLQIYTATCPATQQRLLNIMLLSPNTSLTAVLVVYLLFASFSVNSKLLRLFRSFSVPFRSFSVPFRSFSVLFGPFRSFSVLFGPFRCLGRPLSNGIKCCPQKTFRGQRSRSSPGKFEVKYLINGTR